MSQILIKSQSYNWQLEAAVGDIKIVAFETSNDQRYKMFHEAHKKSIDTEIKKLQLGGGTVMW